MSDASGWMWFLIEVVFVVLLAAGLIYGTMMWRNRPRDPQLEQARDRATREGYKQPVQD